MRKSYLATFIAVIGISFAASEIATADTLRVPKDYGTIQDAVDAASPGDQVRVGRGEWCGANIDKPIHLFGEGGATIIGCPASPALAGVLRIGFFLPNSDASGTTIRHFVFDGDGASNANLDPLSFAVFSRGANGVLVEQNNILGTIQAITNRDGSGWGVNHNKIENFSVLACEPGGFCGGGTGIVFQDRTLDDDPDAQRQSDNTAAFNDISGAIPDNFDVFDMVGILVLGAQDTTIVTKNKISIPDNSTSDSIGVGIEVANNCCGTGEVFETAINTIITKNDGRGSELAVYVEPTNLDGALLRGNLGINDVDGTVGTVKSRSIHTLVTGP